MLAEFLEREQLIQQFSTKTDSTKTVYTISNSKFYGELIFNGVEGSLAGANITVGGIAGANIKNGALTNNWVGGDIIVGNKTLNGGKKYDYSGLKLTAGGVVGSIANDGTVSNNYTWGNIELSKNAELFDGTDYAITELNVGGVAGYFASGTFKGNNSLTSIYIVQRAKKHNINAMIGNKPTNVTGSENYYTHQITLATELIDIRIDVYYWRDSGMLSKFNSVINNEKLPADQEAKGSKLNPTELKSNSDWAFNENESNDNENESNDNENTYYIMTSDKTLGSTDSSSSLNGHLVGDGHTIETAGKTPFDVVNGYVSGILFGIASTSEGTGAGGRVSGSTDSLPNGVATTNNGIIFAVNVSATGYYNGSLAQGNVRYSILSGIANTNNGLISDSGVILNVKDAHAGIAGSNSGVIANSYVTGVVHEGANWSFAGGSNGGIYNSYAAIKVQSDGSVVDGTKVETFFYDKYATEKTTGTGTAKTTDDMSIDTETSTSHGLLGDNWVQSTSYNFGYPYLGGGVYAGFDYMRKTLSDDIIGATYTMTGDDDKTWMTTIMGYLYHVNFNGKTIYFCDAFWGDYFWYDKRPSQITGSTDGPEFILNGILYRCSLITAKTIQISELYSAKVPSGSSYIPNPGKLAQMLTNDKDITLLADIDISKLDGEKSGTLANFNNSGWTGQDYSATLDGNNYQIFNLPSTTGGFVKTLTGTIQNVAIRYSSSVNGGDVGGYNRAGGVAAVNEGIISNVSSSGTRVSASNDAGGLVGYNTGKITDSANYNIVSGGNNNAGGIVGFVDKSSIISNNSNYGNIAGARVGGIAGELGVNSTASISYGYNYGTIIGRPGDGDQAAGGIVGLISGNNLTISNCYNSGEVDGTVNAGGIVGYVKPTTTNYGEVTFEGEEIGPLGAGRKETGHSYVKVLEQTYDIYGAVDWDGAYKYDISNYIKLGDNIIAQAKISNSGMSGTSLFFIEVDGKGILFSVTTEVTYDSHLVLYSAQTEGSIKITDISSGGVTLSSVYNRGSIKADGTGTIFAGGIAGRILGGTSIQRAINDGNVTSGSTSTATAFAGGIVGGTNPGGLNNTGSIDQVLNRGNITASSTDGGWADGLCNNVLSLGKVLNTGKVTDGTPNSQGGNGPTGNDHHNADPYESEQAAIDDIGNLAGNFGDNNWSSHTSATLGTDYTSSTKDGVTTYQVYTAKGFAYAINNLDSTSTIELMNNIDLSDYNWNLSFWQGATTETTYYVTGGEASFTIEDLTSAGFQNNKPQVNINGITYTLQWGGVGRPFYFTTSLTGMGWSGDLRIPTTEDNGITFDSGITGQFTATLTGTIGEKDARASCTLKINSGSFVYGTTSTTEGKVVYNGYEIYGYKA